MSGNRRELCDPAGKPVALWCDRLEAWVPRDADHVEATREALGAGWEWDSYYGSFFCGLEPKAEEPCPSFDQWNASGRLDGSISFDDAGHHVFVGRAEPKLPVSVEVHGPASGGAVDQVDWNAIGDFQKAVVASNLAPAVAEVSHESETSVPSGDECSSPSERAGSPCLHCGAPYARDGSPHCAGCDRMLRQIRSGIAFHMLSGASINQDYIAAFVRVLVGEFERKRDGG